jgi:hydroxymethylpyrimidine/phosphomethylpyrimidine kinase
MHDVTPHAVLVIAGHDPSGAAGIQADVETLLMCGVPCASLVTATTTQDTCRFLALHPQHPGDFTAQARLLLDDQRFSACKIGLLASAAIADAVAQLIPQLGEVPVVLDPILRTGSGTDVADRQLIDVLRRRLLPQCTVITPNAAEARRLAERENLAAAAAALLDLGARNVLVTGGDEPETDVHNQLWCRDGTMERYANPRLPGVYHGSGCTLSSALAAFLARGLALPEAARRAMDFTWAALRHGRQRGRGQRHPDRLAAATATK